jgi:hypothetical protein
MFIVEKIIVRFVIIFLHKYEYFFLKPKAEKFTK